MISVVGYYLLSASKRLSFYIQAGERRVWCASFYHFVERGCLLSKDGVYFM